MSTCEWVSLYSLQRLTGLHRDTLERLCDRLDILVYREPASTPRYEVRVVHRRDVHRLLARAKRHRSDSAGSGSRRGTGSSCSTAAQA